MDKYLNVQSNIFIGCVVGVFLFDRFILNRFAPQIRFQEWRLTANILKFVLWPSAIFQVFEYF